MNLINSPQTPKFGLFRDNSKQEALKTAKEGAQTLLGLEQRIADTLDLSDQFNSVKRKLQKETPQRDALRVILGEIIEEMALKKELTELRVRSEEVESDYLDKTKIFETLEDGNDVDSKLNKITANAEATKTEKEWTAILERIEEIEQEIKSGGQLDISDSMRTMLENIDEKQLKKHLKKLIKNQNAERNNKLEKIGGVFLITLLGASVSAAYSTFALIPTLLIGGGVALVVSAIGLNSGGNKSIDTEAKQKQEQALELKVHYLNTLMEEGFIDEAVVKNYRKSNNIQKDL